MNEMAQRGKKATDAAVRAAQQMSTAMQYLQMQQQQLSVSRHSSTLRRRVPPPPLELEKIAPSLGLDEHHPEISGDARQDGSFFPRFPRSGGWSSLLFVTVAFVRLPSWCSRRRCNNSCMGGRHRRGTSEPRTASLTPTSTCRGRTSRARPIYRYGAPF